MLGLLSIAYSIPAASAGNDIPEGAVARAAIALEETWKPLVERNPGILRLQRGNIDVSRATLGQPFVEYTLKIADALAYANSDVDDLTVFASSTVYTFPISIDEVHMGSIMVRANIDENGLPFNDDEGEYMFVAVTSADNEIDHELLELRHQFAASTGSTISWIRFIGAGEEPLYMVSTPAGEKKVVGSNTGELAPLFAVSEQMKKRIRETLTKREGGHGGH
jgi:hypothetical protein